MPGSRLRQRLRKLHRWAGISAAVFLLLLAVTGIALNHSSSLGLDTIRVDNALILDAYGIQSPAIGPGFQTGERWLTQVEGRVYLDALEVDALSLDALVGAVAWDGLFIVVSPDQIVTINQQAEVVDRAAGLRLPGSIEAIAANGPDLQLRVSGQGYSFDPITLELATLAPGAPISDRVQPDVVPSVLKEEIASVWRGSGLSVERVLVDLHSGRLFGLSGVAITDLAALALCFLAISGIVIWLRLFR